MPAKGLIIMQNGRESVVPNTPATRRFWEDYNTNIQKSKIAHKRFVTILEADQETIEKCLIPKRVKSSPVSQPSIAAENQTLRAELSELRAMLLRMQMNNLPANQNIPVLPVADSAATVELPAVPVSKENEFENFD